MLLNLCRIYSLDNTSKTSHEGHMKSAYFSDASIFHAWFFVWKRCCHDRTSLVSSVSWQFPLERHTVSKSSSFFREIYITYPYSNTWTVYECQKTTTQVHFLMTVISWWRRTIVTRITFLFIDKMSFSVIDCVSCTITVLSSQGIRSWKSLTISCEFLFFRSSQRQVRERRVNWVKSTKISREVIVVEFSSSWF